MALRQIDSATQLPRITVIIPMRNEEKFIGPCLDSMLANDYPHELLEVLVVDGRSNDRSPEIVREYGEKHPFIKLLDNPDRITPCALNVAIRNAASDYIVRLDSHGLYGKQYLRRSIELLLTTDAANVGGSQRSDGFSYFTNALAVVLRQKFAAGDAKYRYAKEPQYADTVFLGAWRTETLREVGGFSEEWVINQDYELNIRLRQAGHKVLFCPDLECVYYPRKGFRSLARQYLRYGFWRAKTVLAYPQFAKPRQFAAPLLVLSMVIALSAVPWTVLPLAAIGGMYLLGSLAASCLAARESSWRYFPLFPLLFGTIHFCWGAAFLCGLPTWAMRRARRPRI